MSRRSSSSSVSTVESYMSALSDDSYITHLKPGLDDQFKAMLNHVKVIENDRKILRERKIQSHKAKKRDPEDVSRRLDWTPQMEADYESYKAKVDALSVAKSAQDASEMAAKMSRHEDLAIQKEIRSTALKDDETWLNAAIAAATARLGFMAKYPNALNTPATKNHIMAAQDNLHSAKLAQREIQIQKKKIENLETIANYKGANKIVK
ncbi:hypothetical protein SCAR479_10033 [Seiridium cardinale]|uniref:Uncharacterized protein n=1 Tax=Seiridium cardinale TaxID=138064 RepID=A0ABR2XHY8_9PEZI